MRAIRVGKHGFTIEFASSWPPTSILSIDNNKKRSNGEKDFSCTNNNNLLLGYTHLNVISWLDNLNFILIRFKAEKKKKKVWINLLVE